LLFFFFAFFILILIILLKTGQVEIKKINTCLAILKSGVLEGGKVAPRVRGSLHSLLHHPPVKRRLKWGVMVHLCNPGTSEAEAGESRIQGQPGLHGETLCPQK
jgi:hypothetical protein